ncbi:MAG TPA: hypothetical protein VFC51_08850 [Chloroflexota bacterium]|nr:hypothetical protein [Chloroflexota bacterium]
MTRTVRALWEIAPVFSLVSRAGPGRAGSRSGEIPAGTVQATGPKVLVAAAPANPVGFSERVSRAVVQGPYRGGVDLEWLLNGTPEAPRRPRSP